MSNPPAYRQIGIVGTGRVARAMALGLYAHSAAPLMLWGRDMDRRATAVASVPRACAVDRLATLAQGCDLIVIAVSDDAIAGLVAEMARGDLWSHVPFVFHVSGRSGAALLDPLRERGAHTAAIHPAMTFTGDASGEVARMVGARFAVTGSSGAADAEAERVVGLLGGVAIAVAEEHRTLYHAALCHAANHLVTLLAGSCEALTAAGVADPRALIAPLVRAALDNSVASGLAALSGPVLRGDGETIAGHLAALEQDCPSLLPAYRAMALATVDALERGGNAPLAPMRDILT